MPHGGGTDFPSVLGYKPDNRTVYRIDRHKVRLHEGSYITDEPVNLLRLKERVSIKPELHLFLVVFSWAI